MKQLKRFRLLLVIFPLFIGMNLNAQVKIYKGTEVIPTYKMGENKTSPIFYTGRAVQGAEGRVYPYPSQTNLGNQLMDTEYEMLYLENEYIKLKVLPAFGGRLFSAIDKTNGHELFHINSVIKPDLIGTLGAWVSGGIEWCFPHHHRTTTMLPSDYRMIKNEDGSATIWIGETEKTMDLRGVVGITLRPGRSFIEVDYRINNTNTLTKNFLFWANVAITANDDFRTFWPPSQEIGVFHNNTSFTAWPVSHQNYNGIDYTEGVDLTWWKNHPNPVSIFMWDAKEGFIGGYDYGQNAGTVHVGNPIENSTSKLWQFGPGLQGQNARRKLTDDGKAYVELMTGTFSNNQPDYSWILPNSVKDAKNYWYPIRDLEIVKSSTKDASVALQMRNDKTVFYGFNTTRAFKNAQLILKSGNNILAKKNIDIAPDNPFTATYKSEKTINEFKLSLKLKDSKGNLLISYTPHTPEEPELPEPQERIKKPEELESVEDLYLTGRFVEQFKRAGINPDNYYLAALEKSPQDYRVNIALGIRRLNQTKYEEALSYFKTAANKLKIKYYQPKEGELYYYMGLAQKELGLIDQAYTNFGRATWYYQWLSSGNFELAQIETKNANYQKALEYIEAAYSTNTRDGRINILYSALLREVGDSEKATELIDDLLSYDPLNFSALYEKSILQNDASLLKWHKNMQDVENNYLEVATHYMNAGLLKEGISLLSEIKSPKNPLTFYYLSWFYANSGNTEKASKMQKMAKESSLDYVFPYRTETEKVLKYALETDNGDATAKYLLGNLLYDNRPEEAMAHWQSATKLDRSFPMVWRNLAFGAFHHQKNPDQAIDYMTKAISLDNSYPLWYDELSQYYDESKQDFKSMLSIFRNNLDIVKKDVAAPKTYVKLLNLNGEYDKAINFLENHHFRTWEGGRETYWNYVNAHTIKALHLIKNKEYKTAISLLNKALLYPENLEVGKPLHDEKNAMIYYFMGEAYKKMGNIEQAKNKYQNSVASQNGPGMTDLLYFQGKSFQKLGRPDKAEHLFKTLITKGKELREGDSDNRSIGVSQATLGNEKTISYAYYLEALGYRGLKKPEKANDLFKTSIAKYKNNLWAKIMMKY
ncbi:Flp pilus assembly protein TadD, contains TPR repeats [Salegentibacter holothuriorum]|uniref:Flp pilus assembly protein TadD, contains TPR repeats n=1 Tax=Salegentibacter holothuriorum TaxID=241145 RepID=A0A1T5AVI9_9FLAO|nr:DUF5107 domain-containing protein [Salegentibacter holothuriorum]SKB38976.1 Flp pilus assembly protein TadD, contains TPR repeats [Salegentibacter holothuriorum]